MWLRRSARLRAAGLHARYSAKTTRNIGKLLKEAGDSGARLCLIIEGATSASVKNMSSGEQVGPIDLPAALAMLGLR